MEWYDNEKVRGRTDRENFDTKKTLEVVAQAMLDFHEFSLTQSQNQSILQQEQKDMETLLSAFAEGTES